MAKFNWKRFLIIGVSVVVVQALLGNFVGGLAPTVTGLGIGGISLGGIATAGTGVYVGELISDKL